MTDLNMKGSQGMESEMKEPRHTGSQSVTSKERRSELRKKGHLSLEEAAEYLSMSAGTLYNRISQSKTDHGRAPRGEKKDRRLYFDVVELDAWDKKRSQRVG